MSVLRRKRKGLSTIVTTALMITAVAVIGTGVVVWSNSNLRTFETNLIFSASNNTNKINEVPIIENVVQYIPPPGPVGKVNVTVTNIGTIGLNVTKITISNPSLTLSFSQKAGGITPHASQLFGPLGFQWASGVVTTVTVTTARGTVISTQVMNP